MIDDQLLDDGLFKPLLEQSQDIHSDAMVAIKEPMAAFVEVGQEARAHGEVEQLDVNEVRANRWDGLSKTIAGAGGLVAASGIGAALLGLFAAPAYAAGSTQSDIMILQTAASIEVLAINTYTKALTLPYIGGSSANKVVTAFAMATKKQHSDHLAAFNSVTTGLGGKAQNSADPTYVPVVNKAVASLSGMSTAAATAAVVSLAETLENVAAETYTNDMAQLNDSHAKQLIASIMGVEAQHVAVLRAVGLLLSDGKANLIALPTTLSAIVANDTALPGNAGAVAFPTAFYPTMSAAPKTQGAVK
ncbi:MAG: ferritin-like domain-containing protein [Acidimicrobiales bacterium]